MKIYFVELLKPLPEAIEKLVKFHAILTKPELGYSEKLLDYSHFIAYKSFRKKNHAKTFELEWLSALACTNNIQKAVEFTRPGKTACIISPNKIEKNVLKSIGIKRKEKKNLQKLAAIYGIKTKKNMIETALEQKICIAKMLD